MKLIRFARIPHELFEIQLVVISSARSIFSVTDLLQILEGYQEAPKI